MRERERERDKKYNLCHNSTELDLKVYILLNLRGEKSENEIKENTNLS